MNELELPLNFEMAATDEMRDIALRHKPHAACIVPEKREEVTTEGGLDAVKGYNYLVPYVRELVDAGIRVSLFVDPEKDQLDAAVSLGAPVVELHTGTYCEVEEGTHAKPNCIVFKRLRRMRRPLASNAMPAMVWRSIPWRRSRPSQRLSS